MISKKLLLRTLLIVGLTTSFASQNFSLETAIKDNNNISSESLVNELEIKKELTEGTLFSLCDFLKAGKYTTPQLYSLVEKLAKRLNIPAPLTLIFKGNIFSDLAEEIGIDLRCNAFAISLTPSCALICIGEDLITQNLSVDELEGVIAHELSHVKYNHSMKSLVSTIIVSCILDSLFKNAPNHAIYINFDYGDTIINRNNLIKNLIRLFILRSFSRSHEKEADLSAAEVIDDPASLWKALYKIKLIAEEKPRLITWLFSLFSTHPLNKKRREYLEKFKKHYTQPTNLALNKQS
ncbi:MAG: M48 family metalloprotease [bacterium]